MIVPKTVSHWTPVTCNFCAELCPGNFSNQGREDPGFSPQFVDKICSDSYFVQDAFIGITFILLMAAIILSTVANINIRARQEDMIKRFYNLLGMVQSNSLSGASTSFFYGNVWGPCRRHAMAN